MKSFLKTLCVVWGVCNLFSLSSCVQTKQIVYFQGDTIKYSVIETPLPTKKLIKSGDLLAVVVNSLDNESNIQLNYANINNLTFSNFSSAGGMSRSQPLGYLVDSSGCISISLVGRVKLSGLSLDIASDTIMNRLKQFFHSPSVSVRFLNHKFSVLGEVNRPSVYNLAEERVTLLEAISMAGDLTIFGKRNNILLIRETNIGKSELIRVDITKRDLFLSPYYYIEPNDVIYVEPLKTKATSTDQNYQLVPIFTGIVSALGILILNLRN